MPFYDYKCECCGYTECVCHAISETMNVSCPKCLLEEKHGKMKKLLSAVPFVFVSSEKK